MKLKNWKEYQAEHGDYLTKTAIQTIQSETLLHAATLVQAEHDAKGRGEAFKLGCTFSKVAILNASVAAMPNVES